MAAGAGMTLAQIDLERPGHDVCAQDVVGVALVGSVEKVGVEPHPKRVGPAS